MNHKPEPKKVLPKLKSLTLKRVAVVAIVLLVGLSMLITIDVSSFKPDDRDKWVTVGSKSAVANVLYGEYMSYVQENYVYIQQNPFLLSQYLNNLISQYITMLLLANEAESINLAVDRNDIIKTISNIPYFQNEDGSFNRDAFLSRINVIFGSEKVFLDNITNNMLRDQITSVITPLMQQPYYLGYLDYLSLTQERTVKYIELPDSAIKNIPTPTNEELEVVLNSHKDIFTLPETRNAEYIVMDPTRFTSTVKISDVEIKKYYDENKQSYLLPEIRNVSQITFENKKDAEKTYKAIRSSSIDEIKHKYTVVDMGEVDYESLPTELSKAIFSTNINNPSIPVESAIGWHIFLVNSISTPSYASLNTVKEEIKEILLATKQVSAINDARNEITNMLNSGESLKNIASKLKLDYKKVDNFAEEDAPSKNIPAVIVNTMFSTNVGAHPILVENDDIYYAINVSNILPTKLQTVEEAKTSLTQVWKADYIQTKKQELTSDLVANILSGKDISTLGYQVKTRVIAYSNNDIPFNQESTQSIFLSPKNTPIEGNMHNTNAFVGIITNIKNSNIEYVDKNGIRNQEILNFTNYIGQSYTHSLFSNFAENLYNKFSVSVNEKAILERLAPNVSD